MPATMPASFDSSEYYDTKDFEIRYSKNYLPRKKNRRSESVEFFFFLGGKMSLRVDNQTIPLRRNDVVYLPQGTVGTPLIIDKEHPNHLCFLRVSKNYISQLKNRSSDFGYIFDFTLPPKPQLFRSEDILFNTVLTRMLALMDELRSDRFGRETEIHIAMGDLILHLNRLAYTCTEQATIKEKKARQTLYRNLIHYIEMHWNEELTLDHLAEAFFVSKYHIAHVFKENLGISLHQYITKKRLSHCRDELLSGGNISKTYNLYGFKDYSSFYRAFKKEYGLSPKAYRDQHKLPNFTN